MFARCNEHRELVTDSSGRVEIRYRPHDGRAYAALPGNLKSAGDSEILEDSHCSEAERAPSRDASSQTNGGEPRSTSEANGPSAATTPSSAKKSSGSARSSAARSGAARSSGGKASGGEKKSSASKSPPSTELSASDGSMVIAYADGACSGNPGPAGLGVTAHDGKERRELSEYLGRGTNNIAELTAILRVAQEYADEERPIEIRTDSKYSIGVLQQGWKAKANVELIANTKAALARLKHRVTLTYVPGHAGVAGNERADELARAAIVAEASSGWVVAKC